MKTTVIHHSADYDGVFCREIARKFLPDAELIGWDFPDQPLPLPDGQIYVLDLPIDRVFGFDFNDPKTVPLRLEENWPFIWIDHHKSSIETHPTSIPGYRIDGVAACRLAWQWFMRGYSSNQEMAVVNNLSGHLPTDVQFKNREVSEPLAVRLAGEYDVWDHRGDGDLEFQFGLDAMALTPAGWSAMLNDNQEFTKQAVFVGGYAMACYAKRDADVMRTRSFLLDWEGLKFLALNTARCNSNTFAALDHPETGHDALMAFAFTGKFWNVSLYHAAHRKEIDLSLIAKKHGGGGHRGACGFRADAFTRGRNFV